MSRSRRKTPIRSYTTNASEKAFKQLEHRRERRAVKVAIGEDRDMPHPKVFGDPWDGPKDGKCYDRDMVMRK